MNSLAVMDQFNTRIDPFWGIYVPLRRYSTYQKESADRPFLEKTLFSEILLTTGNTMQKKRLPIPGPSPEKPVAEIIPLKKSDLSGVNGGCVFPMVI